MMDAEQSGALDRFKAFLNTEPVIPALSRNLTFLLDENRVVDTVEVDDGLRCYTDGRKVVVSGADYLLRDDYDRRHWLAALRVFLAHEVQHDNSSDRRVLSELRRWFGNRLHDEYALPQRAGEVLSQKVLNALEDGRVNNIVCQRFPGYVSMLRFTNYARRDGLGAIEALENGGGELRAFLKNIESYAVAGVALPGAEAYAENRFANEFERVRPFIDAAVLAETAEGCADICRDLLSSCENYFAALCAKILGLDALLNELSSSLEEYQYSDADRREQHGDGTDSGARQKRKSGEEGDKSGDNGDDEEPDLDKEEDGSPGSGDNSVREGDESGGLTDAEAKPKNSAGNYGREDRGESQSDGISNNHGETSSGVGMTNSQDAASEKARQEGPQSIREVLGAGFSEQTAPALTESEIGDMLETASADLDREAAHQKESRVDPGEKTPFSFQDLSTLKTLYKNVNFSEKFIEPKNKPLTPAYLEEAKRLHQKLDRILREQRVRVESQRKGALSQKALWKVAVNDPDVFQRKSPPSKCETAFYLLIDRSGSMGMGYGNGNSKLFTALLTAAVIEEALKGLAYTKVVAFDGGNDVVEHVVIKDFNQKENGNRCFDALDQLAAGNGNKDGYSIRVAAMDLEKRNEKRKVLIVLSDGLPSAYSKEAEAIGDVRTAVQDARRKGVIVIPIIYGVADEAESFEAYQQMYEKGIITASSENILNEFEKLLFRLIR